MSKVNGLKKVIALFTVVVFVMVAVPACGGAGGGSDGAEQADQREDAEQPELERQQEELEQQRQELEERQQGEQREPEEARPAGEAAGDGTSTSVYTVGDAGEVELRVDNGRLALVEARPSGGWRVEDVEEEADEVELDFVPGNEKWEFEAELEDGQIDVEIERDFDD